ncbi:hypothetical protein HHK36_007734 [Tetracentron sinense]|uniref:Dynamin-type G domain-containing protein n=1 Tax=Tetracentron sinense TaxID=13715 RepID=A0A835DJ91_TETSI|nr:hypothetical protein HHK36_007734 [Tetracentron sinense]
MVLKSSKFNVPLSPYSKNDPPLLLKTKWDELSTYITLPSCGCGAAKALADLHQQDRLMHFLMGLHESYAPVRSQILLMDPLPTVSKAYNLILQEQTQRYPFGQKAYRLYDLQTGDVFTSRDVIFHENVFPFRNSPPTTESHTVLPLPVLDSDPSVTHLFPDTSPLVPASPSTSLEPTPITTHLPTEDPPPVPSAPNAPTRCSTRHRTKPGYLHDYECSTVVAHPSPSPPLAQGFSALDSETEPKTFTIAMKHAHWREAMAIEMEAIDGLVQLSESMLKAAALLADEDVDESSSGTGRASSFLNVVALGNVGAGKSAVLNSLIGHPVLPTGENGATRAPISIDLQRDSSLSSKSIILQIDNKSQQVSASALRHSLQDRLSKGSSGKSRDEIYLKLRTSTAPPLKLIDLPGLDQQIMDDSTISYYVEHNDAVLLVIVPAAQAPEISSSRALKLAKEYDADGTRTIGLISKIDQAATDQKILAAVQALLLNQGPRNTSDIQWVALIGQSVSIASAQSGSVGSENSLETAWRAESESLKSILTGAPQSKLGRVALVDTLAGQIRKRMKVRLPSLLSGYMLFPTTA